MCNCYCKMRMLATLSSLVFAHTCALESVVLCNSYIVIYRCCPNFLGPKLMRAFCQFHRHLVRLEESNGQSQKYCKSMIQQNAICLYIKTCHVLSKDYIVKMSPSWNPLHHNITFDKNTLSNPLALYHLQSVNIIKRWYQTPQVTLAPTFQQHQLWMQGSYHDCGLTNLRLPKEPLKGEFSSVTN